jgi:hypothetical protein
MPTERDDVLPGLRDAMATDHGPIPPGFFLCENPGAILEILGDYPGRKAGHPESFNEVDF